MELKIDKLDDLSMEERGGVVYSLHRRALVTEVSTSEIDGYKYLAMRDVLDFLDTEGYGAGDAPMRDGSNADKNLLLSHRSVKLVDRAAAEVDLTYEHLSESAYQELGNPNTNALVFSGEASLSAKKSQTDKDGAAVVLTYTYHADDNKTGHSGEVAKQGAEFDVQIPTRTRTLRGLMEHYDPEVVLGGIVGLVNDPEWADGTAGTWLCTKGSYRLHDANASTPVWLFEFSFEYDPDGWQPKVVFQDPDSKKPPSDWANQATAHDEVDWYLTQDFGQYFRDVGAGETDSGEGF